MSIATGPTIGVALGMVLLAAAAPTLPYAIVGTGQTRTYDDHREIAPPRPGQPFYGQDAQFARTKPSYTISADRLTVYDDITGLTWQRSADRNGDGRLTAADKLTFRAAQQEPARLNAARLGGFTDWRLPSIKQLYSLIQFTGLDPRPDAPASGLTPFIDTTAFAFAYGDENAGERAIDSQWVSSTAYRGSLPGRPPLVFGVNFADGRIKGYPSSMPGGGEKAFFVVCVRGNPGYGVNQFRDNSDGTISDRATALMWTKGDSGRGMNWESALAFAQARNAEKYLGHDDWRLPDAKELQSLVDYDRSPDATGSAAIDPIFSATPITNEVGARDWPFYWTSTTHASMVGGDAAVYVAFGRAAGWPTGPVGRSGREGRDGRGGRGPMMGVAPPFEDVHGAGAQRSDPKSGDPARFPRGRGPQGDVVRIDNFVRLVRSLLSTR